MDGKPAEPKPGSAENAAPAGAPMAPAQDAAFQSFVQQLQSGGLSYEEAKQRYLELGDSIRERYEREVTAMSVDVVSSREAKSFGTPLDAQLTFEAYYRWIEEKLRDYGCQEDAFVWSGDGLLAIFVRPEQAVAMARAIIDGLDTFNLQYNRLRGFILSVRVGIHTGPVLQNEGDSLRDTLGKLASDTLDVAGHLQKYASPNQVAISQTTYSKLHEGKSAFVAIRRPQPNPGTCYAYPPASVASEANPAPVIAAEPPRGAGSALPWVAAISAVLIVASIVVVVMVLNGRGKPAAQSGGANPIVLSSNPNSGSTGGTGVSLGSDPAGTTAIPTDTGSPTPTTSSISPVLGTGAPNRQLWRSPDASSGVPARFVASPPELRWLISIGVGQYRDSNLGASAAGADAHTASTLLARWFQVPAAHTSVLADETATLGGVLQSFSAVQRSAASGRDTVILFLAGAAMPAPDRPDFRHSNGSGYAFFPFDATVTEPQDGAIYGADLAAWLGGTRAQTVVIFADTPFAGALDLPQGNDGGRQIVLVAATGASQRTALTRGLQSSVFLESLAAGIQGEADGNNDRRVTLPELTQYVQTDLRRRSNGMQAAELRTGFGGFVPELDLTP